MAEFRVMTWNVQNLFAARTEFGPLTASQHDDKVASLAALIDQTQPHVIALQELGPEEAVAPLQAALTHQMPHLLLGVPDRRGIRVGLLSTSPLTKPITVRPFAAGLLPVQCGDDPPGPAGPETMNQMGRGALQASVRFQGREIRVVSCHLKSKLLSYLNDRFSPRDEDERARQAAYALYRRTAEAVTLRSHVTAELAGQGKTKAFIVGGDLNDEPDAATTQILHGPPGSEIGTPGFAQPDKGDGARLWNLAPCLPEAERSSRVYRGSGELIDHLFVSHWLLQSGRLGEVHTFAATAALPSITDNPNEIRGLPGSDHAALLATFEL